MNAHPEQLNRKKYRGPAMERCPAHGQCCWRGDLRGCGFAWWLGDPARAGGGSAFCDGRANRLGASRFPVVFLLLNVTWGAFIFARKEWRTSLLWLSTIPIWLVAVAIDFAHH